MTKYDFHIRLLHKAKTELASVGKIGTKEWEAFDEMIELLTTLENEFSKIRVDSLSKVS